MPPAASSARLIDDGEVLRGGRWPNTSCIYRNGLSRPCLPVSEFLKQ